MTTVPPGGTVASMLLVAKVLSSVALARLGTHCCGPPGACSDPGWSTQKDSPMKLEKGEHTVDGTLALSLVYVVWLRA